MDEIDEEVVFFRRGSFDNNFVVYGYKTEEKVLFEIFDNDEEGSYGYVLERDDIQRLIKALSGVLNDEESKEAIKV